MKENWLKEQLTPAKRSSNLWAAFTEKMQDMWNETVEPVLTRISNRKSFFTMDSEDMDTRISEYGRFFIIAEEDRARRPMLLTQRLDEVHFKGTTRPIEQTLWREFGEMPVSWEPLYAPTDIVKTPYGSYLATAQEVESATASYGDFFLTSRGRVVLNLNKLYELYGADDINASIRRFQSDFTKIIVPLIPLHIVYDGLTLQLVFKAIEKKENLVFVETQMSFNHSFDFGDKTDAVGVKTNISFNENRIIKSLKRSLDMIPICFDGMPLDAWPLGMTAIIPPIIPAREEGDGRLYTQDMSGRDFTVDSTVLFTYSQGESRLMLKTLGQYGCIVEYADSRVVRYGFPGFVDEVILQPLAGNWRDEIRQINYLQCADEIRQSASVHERLNEITLGQIRSEHDHADFNDAPIAISMMGGESSDVFIVSEVADDFLQSDVSASIEPIFSVVNEGIINADVSSQVHYRLDDHNSHLVQGRSFTGVCEQQFNGVPRGLDAVSLTLDTLPLDAWPIGHTHIVPAIIPGEKNPDPRIFEQVISDTGEFAGVVGLYVSTLGLHGCIIEYANGDLATILFPVDSEHVLIQEPAGSWRKTIRKINYLIGSSA
ncbi:hypothetical protein [Enterobacter hormaechei]|uniref:hypothetical protein n=1 Tax=Enterobacter hormaechei TaxID=158836 RepID=UPI003F4322AB